MRTWSRTVYCAVHAEELLGREEMIARYDASHGRSWAEMKAEGAPGFD